VRSARRGSLPLGGCLVSRVCTAGAARPCRVAVELVVLTPAFVGSLHPLAGGPPGSEEGGEIFFVFSGSRRGCAAVRRAARAVRGAARVVEFPLFAVYGRHVCTAGRLCGDGGDLGGGGFVMEAVGHGGHVLDVLQPGGHDGVGHGCRLTLEEETLKQVAFCFFFRKEGSHVL
jgi:hypothetical protein